MSSADPLPKSVERKLAGRAADGDNDAVGELYDAYERRLFGYCTRILGNPDDAADATQEAFCNVIQRLPGLDTATLNFGAYLFTAARNASMDILKAQGRFQSTDEVPEDPFAVTPIENDPERALLTGDQMRAAREANAKLPEKQRAALALREVAELSYDDIGEALDMNQNAVAQLISRARLNFGKQLRVGAVIVAPEGEEAQRALDLTAARIDGKIADADSQWLTAYLASNEASRMNAEAMEESAALYRGIGAITVLAGLRETVLSRATSQTADGSHSNDSDTDASQESSQANTGADAQTAVMTAAVGVSSSQEDAEAAEDDRRRWQKFVYPLAAVIALILILAISAMGDGETEPAAEQIQQISEPTPAVSQTKAGTEPGEPRSGNPKKEPTTSQSNQGQDPAQQLTNAPKNNNSNGGSKGGGKNTSDAPKDPDTPTSSDPGTPPPSTPPAQDPPPSNPQPGGGGIPSGPGNICAQPPCTPPPPVP